VVFGEEHYSLVASRVPAPAEEDDLLAGLQASAGAPQLAARD
jgi:hypothetical protein